MQFRLNLHLAQFDILNISTFPTVNVVEAKSLLARRPRGRSDAFGSEARRVKVKQVGEQREKFHGERE